MIPYAITKFFKAMTTIPEMTKISSRVIRVLGCNPGVMTLQGTNTYIVGTGKRRILIDTGDNDVPKYIQELSTVLRSENIHLDHILLTHWHHDHVGGLKNILAELPEVTEQCKVWKFPYIEDKEIHPNLLSLRDGEEMSVEGATLRVLHTPGHTEDHVVLLLLEENALFSGDCILGEGTAVFEDLHDYLNSLKAILRIKPAVIYPGHGNIILDPIDRIEYYLNHRQERENQIMEVLGTNIEHKFSENDLVLTIYKGLDEKLVKAAEYNVNHHLQKLAREGRVVKVDDLWQYKI